MATGRATYRLCPRCGRAVSATTHEVFCINDGERLLERCLHCQAKIRSPHAQFCSACGVAYVEARAQEAQARASPARPERP